MIDRVFWMTLSGMLHNLQQSMLNGWKGEPAITENICILLRDNGMECPLIEKRIRPPKDGRVTEFGCMGINLSNICTFEFDLESGEAVEVEVPYLYYGRAIYELISLPGEEPGLAVSDFTVMLKAYRDDNRYVVSTEISSPVHHGNPTGWSYRGPSQNSEVTITGEFQQNDDDDEDDLKSDNDE